MEHMKKNNKTPNIKIQKATAKIRKRRYHIDTLGVIIGAIVNFNIRHHSYITLVKIANDQTPVKYKIGISV